MSYGKTPVIDILALIAGGFHEETARGLYAQGEEVAACLCGPVSQPSRQVRQQGGSFHSNVGGFFGNFLFGCITRYVDFHSVSSKTISRLISVALCYRVILTAEAEIEGITVDSLLRQLVRSIEVPRF